MGRKEKFFSVSVTPVAVFLCKNAFWSGMGICGYGTGTSEVTLQLCHSLSLFHPPSVRWGSFGWLSAEVSGSSREISLCFLSLSGILYILCALVLWFMCDSGLPMRGTLLDFRECFLGVVHCEGALWVALTKFSQW